MSVSSCTSSLFVASVCRASSSSFCRPSVFSIDALQWLVNATKRSSPLALARASFSSRAFVNSSSRRSIMASFASIVLSNFASSISRAPESNALPSSSGASTSALRDAGARPGTFLCSLALATKSAHDKLFVPGCAIVLKDFPRSAAVSPPRNLVRTNSFLLTARIHAL